MQATGYAGGHDVFNPPEADRSADVRFFYEKNRVADKQPCFILYGDNPTNVNLNKMFAFHKKHEFPFTLGVFKTPVPSQCGIAEVGEDTVVINLRTYNQ